MADLRIVDAPLLSTVKGTEKIPTGGEGNFSVSVNQVADFAKLKWFLATEEYVDNAVGDVQADLNLHKNNSSNPHGVTKIQVGLGNVDNTADLDKPVSNATQSAIITANSGKADKSYVDSQDQLKADKIYVDSQDQLKADKTTVETSLLLKADKVDLKASKIASDGGQNQQQINDFGGAKWYAKVGGYELGATVNLDNGDTVKNTVPNNTANPNTDRTGWVIPYLGKSNNLDDVLSKTTARTNLDVYSKIEVDNAISSAILNDVPNATEIVAGKAKIATTAIAQAGTNDTDFITAKKLRAALNVSGVAPMYACRAWVNFNGTGTVSIRNSGNITSITDSGVGRYVANFTQPMPNADYSCAGVCKGDTIASDRAISVSQLSTDTNTVSAMPFTTSWAGATQSGSFDSSLVSVQVFC